MYKYEITVYALKTDTLGLDKNTNAAIFGFYLWNNTLAKASIVSSYKRDNKYFFNFIKLNPKLLLGIFLLLFFESLFYYFLFPFISKKIKNIQRIDSYDYGPR